MFRDTLVFIRKLSPLKIWNILLVQCSLILSNLLKKPVVWGKPWFVSLESSSVCNLSCPQCPTGQGDVNRNRKFMDPRVYRKILDEIAGTTAVLNLVFQGEPLMHRQFPEYVRLAGEAGLYTQTSTNGSLLSEEVCRGLVGGGLDRLIVSVDGTNQETYQTYRRGGDLQVVEEGIRRLNRIRHDAGAVNPRIIIQFLVFAHNLEQLKRVREIAGDWGADGVWIKSAQIEYPDSAGEWIPGDMKFSRYEKSPSGEWKRKGHLRNRCSRLWQTTVITSDGIVVPCCFDKRAEYPAGDAGEQNVAEIWKSHSYQRFRKQVLADRKATAICMNCTEGIGKVIR